MAFLVAHHTCARRKRLSLTSLACPRLRFQNGYVIFYGTKENVEWSSKLVNADLGQQQCDKEMFSDRMLAH